jgi:DNA-binding transcriptional ArsR family regulator
MSPSVEIDCVTFCKALADETRQRILQLLLDGEQSVGQLAESFAISQPTISHHLGILKGVGLVRSRKEGKHVYYAVEQDHVVECCGMLFAKFCCEEEAEEKAEAAARWLEAQGYPDATAA